ncbi:hypothetical protein LZZ85_06335 [Terrimonas sp. NA20]|uniref:Outer membrane protein beta-barrel domain-containing protein n=1 Tax=Terrimonas ginsenosidimutans TaxID=2908004 RepID=A0ABS9KNL9_9BACT|nr:hypothetical protein [Terrimonas ginsenosidimutans]MCG2613889.1 hypothetical protein [Terrimonas ginsenosidimutans]
MKSLLLLICGTAILSGRPVIGQQFYNTWFYNYNWVWEGGAGAGFMNCLTDLGGRKGNGGRFLKDIDWRSTKPAVSAYLTATYKDVLSLKLDHQSGNISAADSVLKRTDPDPGGRYGRNLHFRSRIHEWQLSVETHPLFWKLTDESEIPFWSPYILAGISLFSFDPEAKIGGTWHKLHPLRLEGQGFSEYNGRKPYRRKQLSIPLGVGLRYETGPLFNVKLELSYRILFTDHLDDVSTSYIDATLFATYLDASQAEVAKHLYNRMGEIQPGRSFSVGEQRGSDKNNDAYFSILLKLGYVFRSRVK